MRGLEALTVLNTRDGATVSEIAHEIRLPRTTVYRILETLCSAGFVFRDESDDRYRLTIMVRSLSDGFDDDAWVSTIAKPLIEELGRELVWPVSLATLSGSTLVLREATDHSSPLAVERYSAGHRLPLLSSAGGRVYLSFSPPAQRDTLIEILARSGKDEDRLARAPRVDLQRILAEVKTQGYAVTSRTRRLVEEISLSVPVMSGECILSSLTVRFTATAVPLKAALERFLPKLKQCAARISHSFVEQTAGAQKRAPEPSA
jgi:IclR family mhp operon transcriptional activator